jgi:thymidylate synthase (FAD)
VKIVPQSVELLWVTPNAEQMIELAGRICYKSEDRITSDSATKFIQMICKRDHASVLEHASASFRVICDRGISHEIVRSRLSSFSQESTRYCSYGKDKFDNQITVIQPPGLEGVNLAHWQDATLEAEIRYLALIDNKVTPQIARSVLPTCLKTELAWSSNFRQWLTILKQRLAPAAHPQIREIAYMIWTILKEKSPAVFDREDLAKLAEGIKNV